MYNLFINFKPDNNQPYGGGNITTYYIEKYFENTYKNFKIIYNLKSNEKISIYLVIDPFKDNKFKKYGLEDIIEHRNNNNKFGKIIVRVNDCDITRPTISPERSREKAIIKNIHEINHFIFNSNFIKNYYKKICNIKNNYSIIYNGCDTSIFFPKNKENLTKYKIVTHHWSDNMNKGYQLYYDLWNTFKKTDNYEFIFIGKNIPDMFKDVPIIGPYVGLELSNEITKCDIYITDSIFDSCPNHVIEAISCGLPILYRNHEGGAKELCKLFPKKIGESYNNFEELIEKMVHIRKNYSEYKKNVLEYSNFFELNKQISKYEDIFLNVLFNKTIKIGQITVPDKYTIILKISSVLEYTYIQLNNKLIKIESERFYNINTYLENQTIFLVTNTTKKKINVDFKLYKFMDVNKNRLDDNNDNNDNNSDKLNVLYSSDKKYFIPMFASLHSVIKNCDNIHNIHFNFIVPIEDANYFQNMLMIYRKKIESQIGQFRQFSKFGQFGQFNYSIVFIDIKILENEITKSKCYDGGNHLLNIGNFSRLMIGEFFSYKKLLYLDSDSICKTDINKLIKIDTSNKLYALKADKNNGENKRNLILKMNSLITEKYCLDNNIVFSDYAFYGAPFLTDCSIWIDVYKKTVKLIQDHNNTEEGIYKLFTMSIQNLIFYRKIDDIYKILKTLPDLGSKRKEWTKEDICTAEILDWSGIYKPWFNNGLYKEEWEKYNIFPLIENFGDVDHKKKTVENFI